MSGKPPALGSPFSPSLPWPPSSSSATLQLLAGGCERSPDSLEWVWDDGEEHSEATGEDEAVGTFSLSPSSPPSPPSPPAGLLVYACDCSVLLYSPSSRRVLAALTGHEGAIRCLRAAQTTEGSVVRVVSGSLDRSLRWWTVERTTGAEGEEAVRLLSSGPPLTGHTGAVEAVDWLTLRAPDRSHGGVAVLCSAGQERSVRLWLSCPDPFVSPFLAAQSLPLDFLPLTVALTAVQRSDTGATVLLAVAGVDCRVHLFVARLTWSPASPNCTASSLHCHLAVVLSGHTDWVRSLHFTQADRWDGEGGAGGGEEKEEGRGEGEDVLLASASQDHTLRLWRLRWRTQRTAEEAKGGEAAAPSTFSLPPSLTSQGSRGCILHFGPSSSCDVRLESLLEGHDDRVMSARFLQGPRTGGTPLLLSCGGDNAALIWAPPETTASGGGERVWRLQSRLGEVRQTSSGGLFGGRWGPAGASVVGHSYSGGLHLWRRSASRSTTSAAAFDSLATAGGHSMAAMDLSWEPQGRYLVSASLDQTTRLFAPVQGPTAASPPRWMELARPQVHGYDLRGVCCVPGPVEHLLASGAEEKVVRVFLAPQTFIHSLDRLTSQSTSSASSAAAPSSQSVVRAIRAHLPELGLSNRGLQRGDEVQQLRGFTPAVAGVGDGEGEDAEDGEGETEKAEGAADGVAADAASSSSSSSSSLSSLSVPPTESQLSLSTLWPEAEKLYGHGEELRCVAASPDGRLIASSSLAKTPQAAAVLLFDCRTWTSVGRLLCHSTTVSCLAFAPAPPSAQASPTHLLVTGGKDRHVALTAIRVEEEGEGKERPSLSASTTASPSPALHSLTVRVGCHSRIVWSCAWSSDGRLFASGSRDRTVRLFAFHLSWAEGEEPSLSIHPADSALLPPFKGAVTAVAFAPLLSSPPSATHPHPDGSASYDLAVGEESGAVSLWRLRLPSSSLTSSPPTWTGSSCELLLRLGAALTPQRTVHRLAFRPGQAGTETREGGEEGSAPRLACYELAIASADHTVRIVQLTVPVDVAR